MVPFPFSDQLGVKLRPAAVVNPAYPSEDLIVVAISSVGGNLRPGEFPIRLWREAGLKHPSFIKRALTIISRDLVHEKLGSLHDTEMTALESSLQFWLGL